MPAKTRDASSDRTEVDDAQPVDLAFRRAALIQDSKVSARRRRLGARLGARRRQGTN